MSIIHYNSMQEYINAKKIAFGAVISVTDPTVAELAGDAGMDFVWIDSEHAALNFETIKNLLIGARASGCASLVRVRANDADLLKVVLDMAPAGVIIPMVNDATSARRAVEACKYPPYGRRGCGVRRGTQYGAVAFDEYLKQSERAPWIIIQIEHRDAVENLDEILQVPGIDSICIGPCDLSGSLGILNQMDDPELNRILDEICARIKCKGKILGAAAGDFPRWKERGVDWFAGISDWGAIAAGFRTFRKECGI